MSEQNNKVITKVTDFGWYFHDEEKDLYYGSCETREQALKKAREYFSDTTRPIHLYKGYRPPIQISDWINEEEIADWLLKAERNVRNMCRGNDDISFDFSDKKKNALLEVIKNAVDEWQVKESIAVNYNSLKLGGGATVPPERLLGIVAGYNLAYKVGHTYEYNDIIDPSKGNLGYEFCVGSPLKILDKFPILDSKCKPLRIFQISAPTPIDEARQLFLKQARREDTFVTSKINIDRELSFEELVREQIAYTKSNSPTNQFYKKFDIKFGDIIVSDKDYDNLGNSYDYACFAISGNGCLIHTTGTNAKIYSIGFGSKLFLEGDDGEIIASGKETVLHATGSKANLIAMGQDSGIFAKGSNSTLISIGDNTRLTAYGDSASCICKGKKNSIHIEAKNGQFCAVEGTIVSSFRYSSDGSVNGVVCYAIGENNIKPDTWYTVKSGEFVEVEAENE